MGRLVGGSTAVNGGTSFRTPNWVMDRWCEEMRTDDFTPDRMEPYFRKVESILQVEPAKRQFVGKIADVFARGCDALGWSHFAIPRNAPGCEGSGFCDFGCRTDARRSTNISYIPPALEKGAMLFTKLRADRVLVEGGRAVGIEGVDPNGKTIRVRGRAVIMAGGALPTPLFLMKQGLCGGSGQLGRNLTLHPSGGLSAMFDDEIRGWESIPQGYGCDQFIKDGMLITAAQPDFNYAALMFPYGGDRLMAAMDGLTHIAGMALLIADEGRGRVLMDYDGSAAVHYRLTPGDVARYHQGLIKMGEMCWAAGAKRLMPALFGWHDIRSRQDFERFKQAKLDAGDLLLTSYHPLGTCRMGADPHKSVVDMNHQAHDLPGLFIVDGSTVSGPLGVNPQLTIMALATRAADRIHPLLS
jgi:choline dehydrogenase-like flavoprotein